MSITTDELLEPAFRIPGEKITPDGILLLPSGKTISCQNLSPIQRKNLLCANFLLAEVEKILTCVPNFPGRIGLFSKELYEKNEQDLLDLRLKIRLMAPEKKAEMIKEARIGNCGECSRLARELAKKTFPDISVEFFTLQSRGMDTSNHVFNVIRRDPSSDPTNYHTWGSDALIVDIWSNAIYPSEWLPDYLRIFKNEYADLEGLPRPLMHTFDPHLYSIELRTEDQEMDAIELIKKHLRKRS